MFEIITPLNKKIRTTTEYWEFIINQKHPIMKDKKDLVIDTLKNPEFIRISLKDPLIYLYYKKYGKYFICVVVKHLNGDGFIITTYLTDRIKEGEEIWRK